jgi:hypothetical protein
MQSTKKVESCQAERIRPAMLLLLLLVLLNKTCSLVTHADPTRHNRSLILHKHLPKFTPLQTNTNATSVPGRHALRH